MSHEVFELLERVRRSGRRASMATVVRTIGTTPRKEGAKMFVGDDGSVFGSVTIGGCVDARVIEAAMASTEPQLLEMQLGDEDAWEIGLTCGGAIEVLVEPLTESTFEVYDKARRELEEGHSVAIATTRKGERRLVAPGESADYLEVLRPPVTLLIFGAAAVAIPLVAFATTLGFKTIVVDNRPRFATRERFPDADELRVGIVSEIVEQLPLGPTTPAVLVAHDYKVEGPVLKRVLASNVPYVGLLGSRRRGPAILQLLRDDGVPEEQLHRVRVPIGLDLGGDTEAEIALSIVSEVVAVMHGRSGKPMSA